jgi:hypothetical protein
MIVGPGGVVFVYLLRFMVLLLFVVVCCWNFDDFFHVEFISVK